MPPSELISNNMHGLRVVTTPDYYHRQVQETPESELVNLAEFIPGIMLDIRYATAANLLGRPLYQQPAAYLRRPAATALRAVQAELATVGIGLKVFDAYRPYSATVAFYDHVRDETYAAPPWRGSRHNRGCAVDVTLVSLSTGESLMMPTDFDELTPAAHADFSQAPILALLNRAVLRAVMRRHYFQHCPDEWWHFDHKCWEDYDLLDLEFAALQA
ncbi:peptidase M15D vanX D-ala-D-ala dipeptidase [Hymenobacter roseosalivarius DSM 11622]|uniref:D-alanyl-D-alanine dipeptidase n=1 Tax=Hymenobacter roseosalivarius DSM 11622 TaxID=645990 RepID=A0A1W1VWG6_9BACT|nr:M15 family metallopeptidase [Hymenobacter roseosalivarius]SMB97712.1 peptidase M15D vanX D-ala-D-ala dipeptidase [Hymenobacter roseosalivarius DSM 11622]